MIVSMACSPFSFMDETVDDILGQLPFRAFFRVVGPPLSGDPIVGAWLAERFGPGVGLDETIDLQPRECRIQRRFLDDVRVFADLPDLAGDFVAVRVLVQKQAEDDRVVVAPNDIAADQ